MLDKENVYVVKFTDENRKPGIALTRASSEQKIEDEFECGEYEHLTLEVIVPAEEARPRFTQYVSKPEELELRVLARLNVPLKEQEKSFKSEPPSAPEHDRSALDDRAKTDERRLAPESRPS